MAKKKKGFRSDGKRVGSATYKDHFQAAFNRSERHEQRSKLMTVVGGVGWLLALYFHQELKSQGG